MGFFSDLFAASSEPPASPFASALLNQIPLGVSVYHLDDPNDAESLRLVYSNPASETITGLKAEEEMGRRLVDIAPGVRETGLLGRYAEVIRTGRPVHVGHVPYEGGGRVRPGAYRVDAIPLSDRSVGIVFEDVSDREEIRDLQAAQTDLERQEQRYRSLVEATAQVVWVTTPEGALAEGFAMWEAQTGQPEAEARGDGWVEMLHPDDRAGAVEAWQRAVASGGLYQTEYRLRRPDGTYRLMEARGAPVRDGDGRVLEWVGVNADVEAERLALSALAASESRFRVLFDAITDVLLVYPVGPDGPEPFAEVNQAAVDLYGHDEATLRTLTIADIVKPGSVSIPNALDELRRQRSATFSSIHQTADGRTIPMQTSARLAEYDGRLCVIALCRDDTERARFQRQLARSNLSLERSVSERTAQLEAFAEDLKILHAITTAEHPTPERRYQAYLESGCEMFEMPIGILSTTPLDPETGDRMYRLEAVVSPDPEMQPGLTVPLSDAFCDAVVARSETVTYADATQEAPDHPACIGRGLRAFIGTPVRIDGDLVGTLNFVSPEPRAEGFAPNERELIEVMADAVARRLKADRAAQAEAKARDWYRSIVETVDEGVIVVDDACEVILSNPSASEFLGLEPRSSDPRETDDLPDRWPMIDADGQALHADGLPEREVLRTGQPVRGSIQGVLRPDGTRRWYRVNATPIDHNADGRPEYVVVSFGDITEYQEAQRETSTVRAMLRSVLDASPDGIMAFRAVREDDGSIADFQWLLVNPRAGEIVGRTPADLLGKRLLEVFPGNREAGLFDAYVGVVETGERFETVVRYLHDGFETSFRIVATPIPSEDGFTVTFADVIEAEVTSSSGA